MDAKAKVVAVVTQNYCMCHPETCCCPGFALHVNAQVLAKGTSEAMDRLADLINKPLTDHEAALAELIERHAATERNACLMAELANEEKNKRLALLTGLEALAGEHRSHGVRLRAKEMDGVAVIHESFADELDALTNPANSENNKVLKS